MFPHERRRRIILRLIALSLRLGTMSLASSSSSVAKRNPVVVGASVEDNVNDADGAAVKVDDNVECLEVEKACYPRGRQRLEVDAGAATDLYASGDVLQAAGELHTFCLSTYILMVFFIFLVYK